MTEENSITNYSFTPYNMMPPAFTEEIISQWIALEGDTNSEWINTTEGQFQNHENQMIFEGEFFIKEEEYDADEFFNVNIEQEISQDIDDFINNDMKYDDIADIVDELSEFLYIPSSTSEHNLVNDNNTIFNLSDQKKSFDAILKSVQAQHQQQKATKDEVMLVEEITFEQQEETPKLVCGLCNRAFTKRTYLIQHVNHKHSDKPFKCAKCSKRFVNQLKLDDHLEKHNFANKKWKCKASGCNKAYAYKADLKIHESNVHEKKNKKHTCDCGKSFSRKDHLKAHEKTHGKKPLINIKAEI